MVEICFYFSFSAQSEEAETRKRSVTFDERLEMISQKLAREFTMAGTWQHFPEVSSAEAIECMSFTDGFSSRISSTAGFTSWALRRLPMRDTISPVKLLES
jgi:hypothetical protein